MGTDFITISTASDSPFLFKFAVVKFLANKDGDEFMEVALVDWLVGGPDGLDDEMKGLIYWPPDSKNVTSLLKFHRPCDPLWSTYPVQVLRFYETFVRAREALPKFMADSTYETQAEASTSLGRGKRNRIKRAVINSSDEEESIPVKKQRQSVPPPPVITQAQSSTKLRKGCGMTVQEARKKERDEVMARLQEARAVAAAKMRRSPFKPKSPLKTTKWQVTPMKESVVNGNDSKTPEKSAEAEECPLLNFLEVSFQEEDPVTVINSPKLVTPVKSPRSGSESSVSAEFHDKSSPLIRRGSQVPSPSLSHQEKGNLFRNKSFYISSSPFNRMKSQVASSPQLHDETEGDSSSKKSNTVAAASKSDGRKNLFPQGLSVDERLKGLQMSVSRVNIECHEISQKLDLVLMNVSRLQRSMLPSEKRLTIPPNMPKLPLDDRQELNRFETFLGENDFNLAAVCDYMAGRVRSQTVDPERKSATNILSKMLTNDLAKEINLEGGNKKIAFRSLNLYKVFQGTLQTAFPDSDLSKAESALKNWLKDAKWRKQRGPSAPSAA